MHIHRVEDSKGNLVDVISYCSDTCHQYGCGEVGTEYEGWDGCHENENDEVCAYCCALIKGIGDN